MAIAIILRKNPNPNRFRDLMINVIQSRYGDSALLCSGFFQENKPGRNGKISQYQASREGQFAQVVARSGISLITVGIHNNTWFSSYQNFRDSLVNAGVNLTAYYKKGLRWHAKVFILSRGDASIFGIIGSSNITKNAFGTESPFNHECDVVLWETTDDILKGKIEAYFQQNDFQSDEVIRGLYDYDSNFGLSVQDRLDNLKAEILGSDLSQLE